MIPSCSSSSAADLTPRIGVSGHDASKGVEADQPLRGVKICKFWELKGCAVLNGQLGASTVAPRQSNYSLLTLP